MSEPKYTIEQIKDMLGEITKKDFQLNGLGITADDRRLPVWQLIVPYNVIDFIESSPDIVRFLLKRVEVLTEANRMSNAAYDLLAEEKAEDTK